MTEETLSAPAVEFPYGWRYVQKQTPDGTTGLDRVPLTLLDVLYPQEGDVHMNNTTHDRDTRYLADALASRLSLLAAFAFVSHDLGVDWGVAGVGNHCPDLGVFAGLRGDPRPTGLLDLRGWGGRCEIVVEVVSPSTRVNDVETKVDHYFRVGVPTYVLIDQEAEGGPRALRVFRRGPAAYEEVPHDPQGRVLLPVVNLFVAVRDDRAVCFDAATGEEIEDFAGQKRARERERAAREAAVEQLMQFKDETDREMTEQVEKARGAEAARKRAEDEAAEQRREADKQRQAADEQKREAGKQKREAGKQKREADRQKQALEELERRKRLDDDAAARRIRDLEEQLRRLQTGGQP